jgi:hypothetical protein
MLESVAHKDGFYFSTAALIKFEPAMKDGRAVSQFIQIERNFYPY